MEANFTSWDITPHILCLWKAHQTDKMIVENLQKVIDTSRYGIGITKFKEICNAMGLQRTQQQNHSIESIRDTMVDLHEVYPNTGVREMVSLLFHEKDMSVSRNVVISYFAAYKADLVHQWKARRLQWRQFWAAGVNDLFTVNQHDKWLQFGLGLHTGIEPFSGRIMWIWVWHSNRNPQLVLTYYLNTIKKLGYIPMITQSNPGFENYGITNAHTMLHQMYNLSLHGTLQHWWMHTKKNVMPEIAWYQDHINNTAKKWDRNKVLPHSVLNLIYDSPEDFGAMDFKVTIDQDSIDHVRHMYIKPDHPVFNLVPQPLDHYIQHHYDDLGQPPVLPPIVYGDFDEDNLPLLEHQRELLCADDTYMGGVHGGLGLGMSFDEPDASLLPADQVVEEEGLVAWFSDEELNDETYEW
ncbi:uncharacterized protein EDB93DRAFT_1247067 [Suillus bovinus]|uniref:uncharacterized protein n=1 Tax=Suillus bovinus TaxID=48563 RepID=UPI001B87B691|nr:uncharacterized protein EDB93DRAFT_1247067 [Suillus bovinus]KAG2156878.1 hypothetical protein EDB93DRAFT_1247067 [Suillus bovinus]